MVVNTVLAPRIVVDVRAVLANVLLAAVAVEVSVRGLITEIADWIGVFFHGISSFILSVRVLHPSVKVFFWLPG